MELFWTLFVLITTKTAWCTDPNVVIRQTFPYTVTANGYKYVVTPRDKDVYLSCTVDNKPADKKLQWIAQNFNSETNIPISTDTDTQNSYKYQIDKPAANNWRLKVQNIQVTDQALYICRVQLGGQQSMNDSRILMINQKPQIIDIQTTSDSTIEEGDSFTLECAAGGIPEPRITWQMAGGGVLPTGGRVLQQPKLFIPSAQMNHRGAYICTAENDAGKDTRRIYLNVKFYPRIKVHSPEVFQAIGYSRTLTCEAKGNPIPTANELFWYKEGVSIEEGPKYKFENYSGSNFVLMKMTINNVQSTDFGNYGCYAENSEGSGENFIKLGLSADPVNDRTGRSSTTVVSISIVSLVMLLVTSLLHFC